MKSPHGFVDIEMFQELATGPCIFCEYDITTVQYTDSPESHIFEIPDRCRDNIEHGYGFGPVIDLKKCPAKVIISHLARIKTLNFR